MSKKNSSLSFTASDSVPFIQEINLKFLFVQEYIILKFKFVLECILLTDFFFIHRKL